MPPDVCTETACVPVSFFVWKTHGSGGGGGRRAGKRDHFLDGQTKLEPVQRVADADLPLDLRVGQGRHDGAALHVGSARRHVPGWHSQPQLDRTGGGGGRVKGQSDHNYNNINTSYLALKSFLMFEYKMWGGGHDVSGGCGSFTEHKWGSSVIVTRAATLRTGPRSVRTRFKRVHI